MRSWTGKAYRVIGVSGDNVQVMSDNMSSGTKTIRSREWVKDRLLEGYPVLGAELREGELHFTPFSGSLGYIAQLKLLWGIEISHRHCIVRSAVENEDYEFLELCWYISSPIDKPVKIQLSRITDSLTSIPKEVLRKFQKITLVLDNYIISADGKLNPSKKIYYDLSQITDSTILAKIVPVLIKSKVPMRNIYAPGYEYYVDLCHFDHNFANGCFIKRWFENDSLEQRFFQTYPDYFDDMDLTKQYTMSNGCGLKDSVPRLLTLPDEMQAGLIHTLSSSSLFIQPDMQYTDSDGVTWYDNCLPENILPINRLWLYFYLGGKDKTLAKMFIQLLRNITFE